MYNDINGVNVITKLVYTTVRWFRLTFLCQQTMYFV